MVEFLTGPGSKSRPVNSPTDLESGTNRSNLSLHQPGQVSFENGHKSVSTVSSGSTYVASSGSQSFTLQPSCPRSKYLELCINTGKYETTLAEIQTISSSATTATICTDGHLFGEIYNCNYSLQKHFWRRFLYRPAGIKFVHFGVRAGSQVGPFLL